MHFNKYNTISKPQEGSTCKDSHAKCFITTNSTAKLKLSLGAVNAVNFEGVFPMRVSDFLSSPAVLPLKILHNDQTHILLIFY